MLCRPFAYPGSSYKILRNSNVMLLVFADSKYQIILLTPCTVIASSSDLESLNVLWERLKDFLANLTQETLENPPELYRAYQNFYPSLLSEFQISEEEKTEEKEQSNEIQEIEILEKESQQVTAEKPQEIYEIHEKQVSQSEEEEKKENTQQFDIEAIIDHIFNLSSLDGIASIVAALPPVYYDQLLWERNSNRETILHMATIKNSCECVKVFLEIGKYITFYYFFKENYIFLINFLFLGVNINAKDKNGWTALHCACYEGFTDICYYLLKQRANVLSLTHSRTIPLHYLVRSVTEENWSEHSKIIDKMLQEAVDINAKDIYGKTPLHHVLLRGRNKQCVEFLVKNDANVNLQIEFVFILFSFLFDI